MRIVDESIHVPDQGLDHQDEVIQEIDPEAGNLSNLFSFIV